MYTIEERLAIAEEKLKRMEKLEEQLKHTQDKLTQMAHAYERNFDVMSRRISKKSDGFFSDLFNW